MRKSFLILIGVGCLVLGGAFVLSRNYLKAEEGEDPGNGAKIVGKPVPADELLKIRADVMQTTRFIQREDHIDITEVVRIINPTKRCLSSFTVRLTLDPGQGIAPFTQDQTYTIIVPYISMTQKYLLPSSYGTQAFDYKLPFDKWTPTRFSKYEVIAATYIDPTTDLHDADNLMAYFIVEDNAKILKAFEKDPSLYKVKSSWGLTPALMACRLNDVEFIKKFEGKGGSVKAVMQGGTTAMHIAAHRGDMPVINYLKSQGVSVDAVNSVGRTPLIEASRINLAPVIETLIEAGADVSKGDNEKNTPLHFAAGEGAMEATIILVDHKANINAENMYGQTPLAKTANYGTPEMIDYLVRKGGDINHINSKSGYSILHSSVSAGRFDTLEAILKAKPNLKAKAKDGKSIRDMLSYRDNPYDLREATKLLDKYGVP